ncbi:MAG: hypothetical protein WC465_01695 [Patescibacteria group bacterium]
MFDDLKQNAPNAGVPQGNTQAPATPQPVTDMFADVDTNNQMPTADKASAVQSGKMKPVPNTAWSPNVTTGNFTPEQMLVTDAKGGKTARLVVILVVVLLVLAGGAAAYYFLVMKKAPSLTTNTNTPVLNTNLNPENNIGQNTNTPADVSDSDSDGLTDVEETDLKTDALNPDTDNDSLSDRDEAKVYKTNPLIGDTDGDGLSDSEEVEIWQTDPLIGDTDGDSYPDGTEVKNGFSPLGAGKLSTSTMPIDLNINN